MNDVFIFANPIAGRGKGQSIATRIARVLEHAGVSVRYFQKPAEALEDDDLRTDSPAIAAITIGGDGTLRGAVERLLKFNDGDASRVPPILVVPLGTANLMAHHLGLEWHDRTIPQAVVKAIRVRRIVELDAARANDRLFLLMAGVGIDATVVHELDRMRSGPIDLTSYALPAMLAIQRYDYPPLRVEVDGKVIMDFQPAMAFVGNVREYGIGFPILSQAKSDDGLLDVCVLPCRSRKEVISHLMAVATGDHVHQEGVVYVKGRSIRIDAPQEIPVQIDGEASGHTPLQVELLPAKLPFIVPGADA